MTPDDLAGYREQAREAKGRAEEATPGPWAVETETDGDGEFDGRWWTYVRGVERERPGEQFREVIFRYDDDYGTDQRKDAAFIAAARSDVPNLADAVLALADTVERQREKIGVLVSALGVAIERTWVFCCVCGEKVGNADIVGHLADHDADPSTPSKPPCDDCGNGRDEDGDCVNPGCPASPCYDRRASTPGEPTTPTLAERHADHYRTCGCLGDSAECCVPTCECHAPGEPTT